MPRYKLRTLLILLAVLPPVLAVAWLDRGIGIGLVGGLALISPILALVVAVEWVAESRRSRKANRGGPATHNRP